MNGQKEERNHETKFLLLNVEETSSSESQNTVDSSDFNHNGSSSVEEIKAIKMKKVTLISKIRRAENLLLFYL